MSIQLLANFAEILAGLTILYSAVRLLPVLDSLNELKKRVVTKAGKEQLSEIRAGLVEYIQYDCPILEDVEQAWKHIFRAGIRQGAASFHFNIRLVDGTEQGQVRFRVDGELKLACLYAASVHHQLLETIRPDFKTPSSEDRVTPRITMRLSAKKVVHLHLFQLGGRGSDSFTLRISDPSAAQLPFSALGLSGENGKLINRMLCGDRGLILFCSPFSAGKSVTCYTATNLLLKNDRLVASIENPVELELPGLTQMQVEDKSGRRFHDLSTLAAQADQDALMIGEIKNEEIATEVLSLAHNHLVLATLESFDILDAIIRLSKFVESRPHQALLDNERVVIVAQRLMRRLCLNCRRGRILSEEEIVFVRELESSIDLNGFNDCNGCAQCTSGYAGRVGIFEATTITSAMLQTVRTSTSGEVHEKLKLDTLNIGTKPMIHDALLKASSGLVSLEDVRNLN